MKILISTPYYLPNVSGITIYIQVLSEELVKKGHNITILTNRHLNSLPKLEIINGVRIIRLWSPIRIGKGVLAPFFPFAAIKEIIAADAINCHLPQPESVWMCFWGRLFGKKVILTHHTDLSFWKGVTNKIIDSGVFALQCLAGLMATKIVSYTQDYADNSYYLKHFLSKVVSIYPPIRFEIDKTDKQLESEIKKYKKNNRYLIGFCGRIAKQKGLEVLIKAVKYLDTNLKKDYKILLVGPTEVIGEKYFEYLNKKYKKILKSRFVFLNNVQREHLPSFYKNMDLLVLPSNDRLESFGWVQIESILCGTPCVATNLPGMRIPVRVSGYGKLFKNNDPKDLSEKITQVLKIGKKQFQENGLGKTSIFDYKKSISEYEKLFS